MANAQSPAARRLLAARPAAHHAQDGRHIRGPGTETSDSIDAKLSDGEFVLPADTVRQVGAKKLRDLVNATHQPSGNAPRRGHFADGGMPGDERKRSSSFGDAAAVALNPAVAQVGAAPAPVASVGPSPAAVASIRQPVQQPMPAGSNSFGDASAAARDSAVAQIPTGGQRAPAADGSQERWANTELGRNVGNALSAMPGVAGALPSVVKTGGAISSGLSAASRLLNAGASIAAAGPAPTSAAGPAPSATSLPSAGAGAGRGAVNLPAVDPGAATPMVPAAVGPQITSDVTRKGNSYSGANIAGDITINGQAPRNGGRISAQNMAAAENLAAAQRSPVGMTVQEAQRQGLIGGRVGYNPAYDQRLNAAGDSQEATQEQGARGRLMTAGGQQPGFTGVIGQESGNGNMWSRTPEQQRRDAQVQAGSIHRQTAAKGNAALKAIEDRALETVRGDAALQRELLQQSGATQRTGMQEQGGTARARLMETGRNDRFGQEQGLARDRFGLEQTAAGYQNRSAQRIETAQQALEAAGDDPAKLSAARQRLLGLQGKVDEPRWKGIALQGATDAMGNKTEGVLAAVNERTGDIRRMDLGGRASAPAALPPRDQLVAGQTYQTARGQAVWDGSKFTAK